MYEHYNRYSYVLNNPLKYTDPSGWKYFYSNRELRIPKEEIPYGWNGITDYINNTGSNYNYMGSFSMYMNNPEQYNYTYGTQTWMQTATQNPSSYFNISSNSIYTNNPQKIGSILNNISRGGTVSGLFELYGGTAPGITIYSTATGFITNQSSIQNTYNWIQNSLNGGSSYNKELLEIGTSALDLSFGISTMLLGSRLNGSSFDYYRMNLGGQNIKTPTRIKFDRLTTLNKTLGRIATPFSIATTEYAGIKVWSKYNSGGSWSRADILNAIDFGIGFSGLGFSGLVWAGLITNPVGISIVGTGLLIYGGVRLGMDTYDYFNKL